MGGPENNRDQNLAPQFYAEPEIFEAEKTGDLPPPMDLLGPADQGRGRRHI